MLFIKLNIIRLKRSEYFQKHSERGDCRWKKTLKKKNFQHLTFILSTVYSKKCTRNTTPEFANKCLPYKRELNTKVTSDNERLVFVSGGFFFAPGDFVNDNRLICNKFDYDLYSVSRKTARTAENFSENERRARDDFTASSRFIQQYALE